MGLINCPDCGKQISERAHTCIGCGAPLSEPPPKALSNQNPLSSTLGACAKCRMADKTQIVRSVLLQDRSTTRESGTIDLKGKIVTSNHGRFQTLLGPTWIPLTGGLRRGSISKVDLAGTTQSHGTQLNDLVEEWNSHLPQPDDTKKYKTGMERFKSALYCRRCAVFTISGKPFSITRAVIASFGPRYLFERSFAEFSKLRPDVRILERHLSISGSRILLSEDDLQKEFKAAQKLLSHFGLVLVEKYSGSTPDGLETMRVSVWQGLILKKYRCTVLLGALSHNGDSLLKVDGFVVGRNRDGLEEAYSKVVGALKVS